jgi:hypothetical protein
MNQVKQNLHFINTTDAVSTVTPKNLAKPFTCLSHLFLKTLAKASDNNYNLLFIIIAVPSSVVAAGATVRITITAVLGAASVAVAVGIGTARVAVLPVLAGTLAVLFGPGAVWVFILAAGIALRLPLLSGGPLEHLDGSFGQILHKLGNLDGVLGRA